VLKRCLPLVFLLSLFYPSYSDAASHQSFTVGGNRPVTVNLPEKAASPAPLLVMLHSASTSGAHQERYMKLAPVAKKLGMIYIAPDGIIGSDGKRVWNASKACCQKSGEPVDDVAYIKSLIDQIDAKYPIDRNRIYFVGHSNGAFMSLTFACTTGLAAGVASLAGAMDEDFQCATKKPFAFLQIHGTSDPTIKFNGGVMNRHRYTSVAETMKRVGAVNHCASTDLAQNTSSRMDFDPSIVGKETRVSLLPGCTSPVALWQISRGAHSPKLPANFAQAILSFLIV
jgi:polyhydroxybutyrate depolymerase